MNLTTPVALDRFAPIDLPTIDRCAQLQTRKDRKYVISAATLNSILGALPADVRALEIDGRRWFGYRSVYFDTGQLDSYRLAATHRPNRFKVRTRTYLDSGLTMAEVKTKSRRGQTVKRRRALDGIVEDIAGRTDDSVREFASEFAETAPYAEDLQRTLISNYKRATLVFPNEGVRVTIDAAFHCIDTDGVTAGLNGEFIVETKTDGTPSAVDRLLWSAGHRPKKISKFATGLAALHPELPANRWNRVLRTHFSRASSPEVRIPQSPVQQPLLEGVLT